MFNIQKNKNMLIGVKINKPFERKARELVL